jgi:hypothetical protein
MAIDSRSQIRTWKTVAISALVLMLGICWYAFVYPNSNKTLRQETLDLSKDLASFAKEREQQRPPERVHYYEAQTFDSDSDRLYGERFEARVLKIRRELEKRGFDKNDLHELYFEHGSPLMGYTDANPFFLHREAQKLAVLAEQLR